MKGAVLAVGFALAASGPADVPLRSETNYAPSWSPDGAAMLFRGAERGRLPDQSAPGFLYEIHVMGADGQSPTRLTFMVHPRPGR